MKKMKILILLILLLGSMYIVENSPEKEKQDPALSASMLHGKSFRLVRFNDTVIPPSQDYEISFTNEMVNAKFCNNMGGEYTIQDGIIKGLLSGTQMYCGEPANLMEIETAFGYSVNGQGAAISLSENALTIISTDGSQRLVFVAR